jgi:hypothetical protein
MKKIELSFWVYDIPQLQVSIEDRHRSVVQRMKRLRSPFSWQELEPPPVPPRTRGSFLAQYEFRYPEIPIHHSAGYHIRDSRFLFDKARCDDFFCFEFGLDTLGLNYQTFVHLQGAELVAAIGGYRAALNFSDYRFDFEELHADEYQLLIRNDEIDTNGRNNIFSLNPVHYWHETLCRRALGYGREEVIRRLTGKVPRVEPLMDGVYVVFSDNPDLTFEEYCAYNDALKPVLGLV